MTRYTATTHHDGIDIEWSYDVDPAYRGGRIDPPENAAVANLSARFVLGKRHWSVPDEIVEYLRDDASLLISAQEQDEAEACDAADYRRELAQEYAA